MSLIGNRPCDQGRALGSNLARFADHAEKEMDTALGFHAVRCVSCTFRAGTFPNECASTTMDATKALMEGERFMCHHGGADAHGELTTVCAGWLMLQNGTTNKTECPWPYTGVAK